MSSIRLFEGRISRYVELSCCIIVSHSNFRSVDTSIVLESWGRHATTASSAVPVSMTAVCDSHPMTVTCHWSDFHRFLIGSTDEILQQTTDGGAPGRVCAGRVCAGRGKRSGSGWPLVRRSGLAGASRRAASGNPRCHADEQIRRKLDRGPPPRLCGGARACQRRRRNTERARISPRTRPTIV